MKEHVGNKAWNLCRLRELGFTVPRFLVLSGSFGEEALAPCRDAIEAALREDGSPGLERVARASPRIARTIAACTEAAAWRDELTRAVEEAFGAEALVAVRSSAACEDSGAHSFAGLLDTALNVLPRDVPDAVARVWASAWSARALAYRLRKGLGQDQAVPAVIVQEMIQATVSGVTFSRDPAEGRSRRCLVVAGLGLGEGVVTGAVACDTYRIPWDGEIVEREIAVKEQRVVAASATTGGTRLEGVPEALRSRPALSDDDVRRLRDEAVRIERAFGSPQDVEWAQDAGGRLFVLQARPIIPAPQRPTRVWDNSNIVESYPGLTLPLTFGFVRNAYEQTFRTTALRFLPVANPLRRRLFLFKSMVGLLDGRVYYNLLNWYAMLGVLPAPERRREAWDRLIGITEPTASSFSKVGRTARACAFLAAAAILLRQRRHVRRFFARFARIRRRFEDVPLETLGPEEVVEAYRALEQEVAGFWHLTIFNDFCAMTFHTALLALCRRFAPGATGLPNALLRGAEGMESVGPVHSLLELARLVRDDPRTRALFADEDEPRIWRALQDGDAPPDLRAALLEHLRVFGDRGLEELKLETPSLRDEPHRLVGLIRRHLEAEAGTLHAPGSERGTLAASVPSRAGRLLIGLVLGRARAALRDRENMRFARSRLFGLVRRLFRRLGALLTEEGLLEAADDVFYLAIEEALGVVEGTAVTRDLKALVALRKSEYAAYAREERGERLESEGIPRGRRLRAVAAPLPGNGFLTGTGCSAGRVSGRALVVSDPSRLATGRDRILVTRSTDPGWVFLMVASGGLVVERGSLLSHTAIIGRELGIPTVVGAKGATRLIPDGAPLTIDGTTGEVRWRS